MTYITQQTSEELREHMKKITSMEGWRDPLVSRLWKEIQELDETVEDLGYQLIEAAEIASMYED